MLSPLFLEQDCLTHNVKVCRVESIFNYDCNLAIGKCAWYKLIIIVKIYQILSKIIIIIKLIGIKYLIIIYISFHKSNV